MPTNKGERMPRTEEVTAYYIRDQDGACFYVDTLAEALEEFLGEKGYRLSLSSRKQDLVLWRTSEWSESEDGSQEGKAHMVYRNKEF